MIYDGPAKIINTVRLNTLLYINNIMHTNKGFTLHACTCSQCVQVLLKQIRCIKSFSAVYLVAY